MASSFDTPDSRAALERRLDDAVSLIGDETLRRHYQADMKRRLTAFFGEERRLRPRRESGAAIRPSSGAAARFRRAGPASASPKRRLPAAEQARPQGARAGARGHDPGDRARPSRRCSRAHWEELAALEFAGARLAAFRDALIAAPAEALQSPEALAEGSIGGGPGARSATAFWRWPPGCRTGGACAPNAAPSDAEHVLRQSLALHRRAGALNRELKLAERSLAAEPNEQNFARLLDIKANLADLAHAEAAIEGFGEHSGRPAPSL